MIRAEYSRLVWQQGGELCEGPGRVACLLGPVGNALPGSKGVGVVRAKFEDSLAPQLPQRERVSGGVKFGNRPKGLCRSACLP